MQAPIVLNGLRPGRMWRLAAADCPVLDGEGARRAGGRWNSPGWAVVYTSGSLDVAIRELAHTDPAGLSSTTTSYEIEIPDTVPVAFLDLAALPHDWCEIDDHPGCRAVGDQWLADGAYPVLAVPSAVVNGAWNYLVNPVHAEARQVRVVTSAPVRLDRRLLD